MSDTRINGQISQSIMVPMIAPSERNPLHGVHDSRVRGAIATIVEKRFGGDRPPLPDPKFMQIVANKLFVDRSYQRDRIVMPWVRKIAAGFDPDKFHPLIVSARPDGRFAVIDGQQRLAAIDLMGWLDQLLPCQVYEGLTVVEEAALFYSQDEKVRLTRYDLHRAGVTASREVETTIQGILDATGYRPGGGHDAGEIGALHAVYAIYRESNEETAKHVLRILATAWRPREWQPNGAAIKGVKAFLVRYKEHENYEERRLLTTLESMPPKELWSEANKAMGYFRGAIGTNAARVLTRQYNKALRSRRLPDWDGPSA